MEYINIKNSTNQTINVHKIVFLDLIKIMSKKLKEVKIINEPEIIIVRSGKNIEITFDFTISEKAELFTVTNNIKKFLIDLIIDLFDFKPYNILMNYKGRH